MIYCPYTNQDIDDSESSWEHILPLSLGGLNGFEIPVSKAFNVEAGSEIDGALANDFLVVMRRNELDVRGHSGKQPVFTPKNAKDGETGRPLQVRMGKNTGLKVRCPIEKKEVQPRQIAFKADLSTDIDLRFVAKTALSAGYFAYGDIFRQHVKHEELRYIMRNGLRQSPSMYEIESRVDSRFSADTEPTLEVMRAVCRSLNNASVVGFVPSSSSLAIFVGILGHYMGMVNVPAETKFFPNEDHYHWGHVISPQEKILKRASWRKVLEQFASGFKTSPQEPA